MYVEFDTINEIKKYIEENPDMKEFRVLDCYMNEINLADTK